MTSSPSAPPFRAPAVPLVTHTPFFSVWSMADRLTDDWARHWTSANQSMCGLVRIDDVAYRFAGPDPSDVPALEQEDVRIDPTRTTYTFVGGGIRLWVEFLSPLLADDLDVLTRPVTYVTLTARSIDHQAHEVTAYLDVCAEWCANSPGEKVYPSRFQIEGLQSLAFRAVQQQVLQRSGDRVRIEWGTLVLSTPTSGATETTIHGQQTARTAFAIGGSLPTTDDLRFPRPLCDDWPVLAVTLPMGAVGAEETTRFAMIAYDEEFAIEFMNRKLPPYWRRNGAQLDTLLTTAAKEHTSLRDRCREFDGALVSRLTEAGGERYALLASLAYRQCLAAHGIVEDVDGSLMMFSKENDSNGCIGTVDVTYPGSPFFLALNPTLLKAQVEPVLKYGAMPRWRFPFAPHDLGTYPLANGQVYGGGERSEDDQMPVEECGNMLILVAALCKQEKSSAFADPYWEQLGLWAEYLLAKGLDPSNQLCTDDFAGHLAHNANLSVKAIVALGAFGELCRLRGDKPRADEFLAAAKEMAKEWLQMAEDGDHTKLAFDKPGTWSQKYNLVWDRLLRLGLFPSSLAVQEVAYYRTRLNEYGLPLDGRKDYTKLDWCVWTASLATNREDFDAIVEPLVRFCEDTVNRVPLSDWYDTVTARREHFEARSVVGGVYIPLLKPM